MQVTVGDRDSDNQVTITLETEAGWAKEAYEKTLRKLGQDISIKGFRKGKAPLKVIEEHVGAEYVRSQTLDENTIMRLFNQAFQTQELDVAHISTIDSVVFEAPDQPVSITGTVELFPEFSLPDLSQVKLIVKVPEVDIEKYYQESLENLRLSNGEFVESSEPIELNDEIIFDFAGEYLKDEGTWEPKPGMSAENYQIIVSPGRFIDNFLEQMVGMKPTEQKTLEVKFPEHYHDAELSGKPARFKVTVHKISKPIKAELNDELAKKLNSENIEELKQKIRKELQDIVDDEIKSRTAFALIDHLVEAVKIDIRDNMLQRELDQELAMEKQQNNLDEDEYIDYVAELDMDKRRAATFKKLQQSLIISKVVSEQKLKASQEEIQAEFARYRFPRDYDMSKVNFSAVMSRLSMDVLSNKAIEYLKSQVKIDYDYVDPKELEHVHGPHCNH